MADKRLASVAPFLREFRWIQPEHAEVALMIVDCGLNSDGEHSCHAGANEYHAVQLLLATHPETPSAVLDHLAALVACPQILERIAGNRNTSAETLLKLSAHAEPSVRCAAAENANTPKEALHRLLSDDSADVRYTLAESATVPSDILESLLRDQNPYVAHRAHQTLDRRAAADADQRGKTRDLYVRPARMRRIV